MVFVSNRVKEARELLGLSQSDLARRSKLPEHTIKNLEADRVKNPSYITVTSLARALKKSPGYFFAEPDVEIHSAG